MVSVHQDCKFLPLVPVFFLSLRFLSLTCLGQSPPFVDLVPELDEPKKFWHHSFFGNSRRCMQKCVFIYIIYQRKITKPKFKIYCRLLRKNKSFTIMYTVDFKFNLRDQLAKKLPVIKYLWNYSQSKAATDLLAGVTVGLMIIPQSIAYAALAGLNPQYGLYSSIAGGLVYAILGTVKQVTIGPTALLAIITHQYAHENPSVAALLSFISGSMCILFGFLNLGFIINFVSSPVISGYTSAAAVVIASSQIKGILGMKFSSKNFLSTIYQLIKNINSIKYSDAILGFTCIAVLIILKEISKVKKIKHFKLVFYISIGKNLIVVCISTVLSYTLHSFGKTPFTLTGNITEGLPTISLPNFSPEYGSEKYTFLEVLRTMSFGITTIILIVIISEIVVAKVFLRNERIDASQEIIALGTTNLLGSFIGAMPVSGSFSRSAVNSSCGVKTPLAGIYTAMLVVLALLFLTPYFYYIPRAALSAIIITAVVYMIEFDVILPMWKHSRKDIIPALGTFISALCFGIEFGLICGLLIDMVFLMYYNTCLNIIVEKYEKNQLDYLLITPRNGILYPAANILQEKMYSEVLKFQCSINKKIVLNLQYVSYIDYTTLQTLKKIVTDFKASNYDLIIVNVNEDLRKKLTELSESIYKENVLESSENNFSISL